jgi:uncharacterized protein (TIGR03086 family)
VTNTDHRPTFFAAYEQAADIAAGVEPSQLGLPTVCPELDIAAMIDHLVGAANRAAALGRGEQPTAEEFPHVELSDAPDALRRAGKEARAAWSDDDRLRATIQMPWGEVYDGYTLVNMYLTEITAHAWDLAQATGQLDRLDPALAATALEAATAMLKPEYRDLMGPGSPFGQEVAAPAGATDWERLVAFTGRPPRPAVA